MATWAIGDVHGCFRTLEALLERIDLDFRRDRLWMVGDLVNRGPRSLEVLRWARAMDRSLGDRFQAVLGNHDLHLIARRLGVAAARPRDTLEEILRADDGGDLVEWLRRRPFVHFGRVAGHDHILVHAGLPPGWSAKKTLESSERLGRLLQGPGARRLLRRGSAGEDRSPPVRETAPTRSTSARPRRTGTTGPGARDRAALAALTRTRMLDAESAPHDFNGPPEDAPAGLEPWFRAVPRACAGRTVVCGHWAALGLRLEPDLVALDTGCVWGGTLTAVRLGAERRVLRMKVVDRLRADALPG